MRITWDSALVAGTARALKTRFGGSRIRGYHLDPTRRRLVLHLREATLAWELHPERLGFRILEPADPPPEATPLPARLTGVRAPEDDRVLVLETRRVRGKPPVVHLVLELLPNQENVLVTEGPEGTIRALLRTREGDRPLRRGRPYTFPPPSDREGIESPVSRERWDALTATEDRKEAKRALLGGVAWTSPLVLPSLLEEGGYDLWLRLRGAALGESSGGAVVLARSGPHPYPLPLPERTISEHDDLLAAFAAAEAEAGEEGGGVETLLPGTLLEALEDEVERARTRAARMEEELQGLPDPEELQGWGDLLLARFHLVPEGEEEVTLEDFAGGTVTVPLDPALSPDGNARRHYDRAARVRRAVEELPARIGEAREAWETLEALLERVQAGEASREEVEAAVPDRPSGKKGEDAPSLPYRRFRSTGGLEIRVGRGAARNDDLTFHHARPDEIWLHARHTAGAHVILRWEGEGSPPPRDLQEAAVLAALHSKARTSGSVPVDWTRRKYVRKPRKAPPGAVVPERVKTVFVTPVEGLLEKLKDD